jgi:hypothetical protein
MGGGWMDREKIRAIIREQPEYTAGRITDEQIEEFALYIENKEDELLEEFLRVEIRRELIRMAARGWVEYDAETDTYRTVRQAEV